MNVKKKIDSKLVKLSHKKRKKDATKTNIIETKVGELWLLYNFQTVENEERIQIKANKLEGLIDGNN